MKSFDFSRSSLLFRVDLKQKQPITLSNESPTTLNNARINLECICDITDINAQQSMRYVLGASCKTELVGVSKGIWTEPNGDFCLVASEEEFMIIKSWQKNNMGVKRHPESLGIQPERQLGSVKDAWVSFHINIAEVNAVVLDTLGIIDAVFANKRLVSRIEYTNGNYHVRIDQPVKTINVNERDNIYQTDTGPIILPDFIKTKTSSRMVGIFDLAYSAFNCNSWAEFIVNVSTPVGEEISVNHYSKSRRIENMNNVILGID